MPSGFAGLPDRPVTEGDTRALHRHSAITFCHPVYQLADDPDSIVVIALAKDDRAYFLYYDPEDQQWEQLVATDLPETVTDDIPFSEDVVDDRLYRHYNEDDLEPAGYPSDPVRGAIQGFPAEPLTDTQLETMQRQHPMIGSVMPLVNRAGDGRTIALIFFFDDVIGEQRITAAAGYDPEFGEWQLIDSARSSDPELEQELEHLRDRYATWVADHYTLDEIDLIEDLEGALVS